MNSIKNKVVDELFDNNFNFDSLPKIIQHQLICNKLKSDELYLAWIPKKYLTEDICIFAININLLSVYDVPFDLRTDKIIEFAKSKGLVNYSKTFTGWT
jgi:hypothetical protein